MNYPGLRTVMMRPPRVVGLLFLLCTAYIVWGNIHLPRGGMFDGDVILRQDDPYRQQDHYVTVEKRKEGFLGQEAIVFYLNGGVSTVADLARVHAFTKAVEDRFGETVLSLANVPRFVDDGEGAIQDEHYITTEELARPDFSVRAWKERVAADPSVFGVFVARDFAWLAVVRYLPPDHDEIQEYRQTVAFLEGRSIPPQEWLWRTDVQPKERRLGVSGWVMGRGELDQGLNVDMITLVCIGVVLALIVFWLVFGRAWDALLCVGVMVACGFLWTRGLMGLLGMTERVFSVLVYASAVVTGTSFALHKIEAYRESTDPTPAAAWRATQQVDGVIVITGLFSVYGFLTLWYNFDVAPIRELGVASAVGTMCLVVLVLFFLPALHQVGRASWTAPDARQRERHPDVRSSGQRLLDKVATQGTLLALWLADGNRPYAVMSVAGGLFLLAATLFVTGHIESRTRALDYVRGTAIEKQARYLNEPGNPGFEFLDLLVEPAGKGDLYDPRFIARAWEYQQALHRIAEVRETFSVLESLSRIARESYHTPLPMTRRETYDTFETLEGGLSPLVLRQLYFPHGGYFPTKERKVS